MKHPERIAWLMFRYVRDELSVEEELELNVWRSSSPENEQIFREETDPEHIRDEMKEMYANKKEIFQKIVERYPGLSEVPKIKRRRRFLPVAAAVIFLLGTGIFFYTGNKSVRPDTVTAIEKNADTIKPGGNHAFLTLANGSVITLDSAGTGIIAEEGSNKIIKRDNGLLQYSGAGYSENANTSFNTLTTPRGGQYTLMLPDGTIVWLNAASSLKYPASFSNQGRVVELQGEAYFEVSKVFDKKTKQRIPFRVRLSGKPDIEVLGTHFDIMAYHDEPFTYTTLLEGSVSIGTTRLIPGQQARIENNGTSVNVINGVDLSAVVAWKNGNTSFKDAGIQEIMRTIARWYDVEVEYKGVPPDKKYKGGLPRNTDLKEVLEVLNQNNIHFTITGKKIVVTP